MSIINRKTLIVALVVLLSIGTGAAIVAAAQDDPDTPIPVEPDGGIGDTPGDQFPVEDARNEAHGLLGRYENTLPPDVRIARRGQEQFALTEDYRLGRLTVELDDDGDGYRVTSVTVELPDGPETYDLTPS